MTSIYAIVLAAGKGTRMKSDLHKVLHPIGGKAMALHLVTTLEEVGVAQTYFIVGHGAESVMDTIGTRVKYCLQQEQLGTGHAVLQAEAELKGKEGITLLINGDTPLITSTTLKNMIALHQQEKAALTLLTTKMENPYGYGRVVYGANQSVQCIVEEKDATEEQKRIQQVNVGVFCVDNQKLFSALHRITNHNSQGEYYLTDIIPILLGDGERICAYETKDTEETVSINDRLALSQAEAILRKRINERHMLNGVTLQDPLHTYIDADVVIEPDVTILAGTQLRGKTIVGKGSIIGPDAEIVDCHIGKKVRITRSVVLESTVDDEATIGPFAYIRPQSVIGKKVKIGDFVEVKKSKLGDGTKVSHLSYIGDAEVGRNVNVGCGAITVNYDGFEKHTTIIEDDAFIGCNVNLIAPVQIGQEAFIAAGSTINRDVPAGALAIARERQTNKEQFALRRKAKRNKSKP